MPPPVTLLLVMDPDLFRTALSCLLSTEKDIQVVAAVGSDGSVLEAAARLRPQVVVIDIDPASTGTLNTVRTLRQRLPQIHVVVLTVAEPPRLVQHLLAAGVRNAVDRNAPVARLLAAIRGAAQGEDSVDAHLAATALAAKPNPLTNRERQVLTLVADGATGPQIAKHLHLTPGTVRNYLSRVITKTNARTRIEAVRIARDAGWI